MIGIYQHFRYVLASASYQELLTLVNGMRAASRAVTSALMLLGRGQEASQAEKGVDGVAGIHMPLAHGCSTP